MLTSRPSSESRQCHNNYICTEMQNVVAWKSQIVGTLFRSQDPDDCTSRFVQASMHVLLYRRYVHVSCVQMWYRLLECTASAPLQVSHCCDPCSASGATLHPTDALRKLLSAGPRCSHVENDEMRCRTLCVWPSKCQEVTHQQRKSQSNKHSHS